VSLKIFTKRKKLKTVFIIHKAWICCSLIIATVIISLICFWWATNYFSKHSFQLSLLISLFIALLIPIISFSSLRGFFSNEKIKDIIDQPKTQNQLEESVSYTKRNFRKKKLCFLILLAGFLFLLFAFNIGKNLISIVYDNSGSMVSKNAIEALSETFDNLSNNNEIVLTTLEGLGESSVGAKNNINEILAIKSSSQLQGGNVAHYPDPISAQTRLNQITNDCWGSPICESIWKTFLFIKETLANEVYKNKVLIVITDGDDIIGHSINSSKFFFDVEEFAEYFPSEKVFIIDYSDGKTNPFLQKTLDSGCPTYNVTNNKQEYLSALDDLLKTFKNNWYLIIWTVVITAIMSLIALFIQPKKIV